MKSARRDSEEDNHQINVPKLDEPASSHPKDFPGRRPYKNDKVLSMEHRLHYQKSHNSRPISPNICLLTVLKENGLMLVNGRVEVIELYEANKVSEETKPSTPSSVDDSVGGETKLD